MHVVLSPKARYVAALGLATTTSAGLLFAESLYAHGFVHGYLLWNLFLAWIPLLIVWWLRHALRRKPWSSWEALAASAVWVVFLPNSFYMVSDFIHLADVSPDQLLFSTVTLTAFIFTALVLGFASLYVIHQELLRRISARSAASAVSLILLLSSVAIYIGRDLRWNTWDVLVNPQGLLFDVSERLLQPSQYPQMLVVVLPFFALLATMYIVAWQVITLLRAPEQH